ncbi:MAG TPA: polysaccharide biosynthesis tyrosine autokinase, partial [Solirubrobacteraceae bacterium]|nr:polysaccharide biosynthesis tyrosine autokinase [Solirubrobacteraceae bacterium]
MADLQSSPEVSGAPTVSPFELLAVLWRRRLVVALVVLISVIASVGLSLRSPKQYSSSAQLLFRDPGFAQALYGNNLFSTGAEEPQRTTQTSIDVVTSLNVAEVAAGLLKTRDSPSSLIRSISVEPNANADIATVQATRSDPREAAAVANAFADGYVAYRRESDRAKVAQAEELVNQSIQTSTSSAQQAKLEESLRQLGVLRALQTGNAEVIERAQPNGAAVSPKPKRDGMLGLVVGLLVGCALALLVDFLDRRLKVLEDFERACPDYPVIASVPHMHASVAGALQLTGPTGESYRMLREGLRFLDPDGHARCFVVTSADEGEGKSTVAVNLAHSVAAVGRRVILVEADMHRPRVTRLLGVERSALGLSDLLVSDAGAEEFLVSVEQAPGLMVLPSGTHPPNAADLLSAGRMEEVLLRLRESADVVIVDSPPLLPVADTRVLLRLPELDGVVLVGRAGVSRRDRMRAAVRVLSQSGRRVFGLVVTDVKGAMDSSYYYHY